MYNVKEIFKIQKKCFEENTYNIKKIIRKLKNLKLSIKRFENEIFDSFKKDFNRTEYETYYSEIVHVNNEINYFIKNIKKLNKKEKVYNNFKFKFFSKNYVVHKPYGCVLILTPYSHPLLYAVISSIGAYASGNRVILKLSPYPSTINDVIRKIFGVVFSLDEIFVIDENKDVFEGMFKLQYDYVLFIGNKKNKETIFQKLVSQNIPMAWLNGNKCPMIIDKTCDLKKAASIVVWSKLLNAGQSSISPDYFLIHNDIYDEFTKAVIEQINIQFPPNSIDINLPCIINENAFSRLVKLTENQKIIYTGEHKPNFKKFYPTIIEVDNHKNILLNEEIFGPIFTFVKYSKKQEIEYWINQNKTPSTIYCFSKNKSLFEYLDLKFETSNLIINDAMTQIYREFAISGIKESGHCSFRYKYSFDLFTYKKNIMIAKKNFNLLYAPFRTINKLKDRI